MLNFSRFGLLGVLFVYDLDFESIKVLVLEVMMRLFAVFKVVSVDLEGLPVSTLIAVYDGDILIEYA